MSDAPQRAWRFYVDDMISFAQKVIDYTKGMDQERFVISGLNYDATLRNGTDRRGRHAHTRS